MPLSEFRELPWDDQQAQRAWCEFEDGKCPGCGGQWTSTTDDDSQVTYQVEPVTCRRCEAIQAEKSHRANESKFANSADFGRHLTVKEVDRG